jgi:hypothetical protein
VNGLARALMQATALCEELWKFGELNGLVDQTDTQTRPFRWSQGLV